MAGTASAITNFINAQAESIAKFAGKTAVGGLAAVALAEGASLSANTVNPQLSNLFTNGNPLVTYPSDLPTINGEVYGMLFQFYKYNRPSILVTPTLQEVGACFLPIPGDLVDTNSQVYDQTQSGAAVGAGLEAFGSGKGATAEAVAAGITQDALNAGANAVGLKLNSSLAFAGLSQNPFLSMLYGAPAFKRFRFSWLFVPENKKDGETLNLILNTFRYHMMPDTNQSVGGTLLSLPDMCIPQLLPSGFMCDFKQCVIESASIDYIPADQIAFNTLKQPNAIRLTIQLIEIEYWVRSDIASAYNGPASKSFGLPTASINAPFGIRPYSSAK